MMMSDRKVLAQVRFTATDKYGLWREDDTADDLGWESEGIDAPAIRLLRVHRTGEILSLYDPFTRGQIERIQYGRTAE